MASRCPFARAQRTMSSGVARWVFLPFLFHSLPLGPSLVTPSRLRGCGCLTSSGELRMVGYRPGSPQELDDADWCRRLVNLLLSLTRHRLRHLLFYTHGPGFLASLLSSDPVVVSSTLNQLQAIWAAWTATSELKFPRLVKARKRSWLSRPFITFAFSTLAHHNQHTLGPPLRSGTRHTRPHTSVCPCSRTLPLFGCRLRSLGGGGAQW